MSKSIATAVWFILQGKPIHDPELREAAVSALRSHPDYLKPILKVAGEDKQETLSPKLEKYADQYRRSPNQTLGRTITPKFIVLHDSYGTFKGTVSWITDPASDVSYHYSIDPETGNRVQHVFDTKRAWHAGRSYWKGLSGLNSHSIGIAFMGNTYERVPELHEIDSCARKCIQLMNRFDIGLDDIVTHQMIAPNRKQDTSPSTFKMVLERINKLTTEA